MRTYDDLELWRVQPETGHLIKLGELLKEAVPGPWEATVEQLLPLCQWYYSYHGAGGRLHIALDDGNLEDSSIDFCTRYALDNTDLVAYYLSLLIRTMTEDNRELLYEALHGHKP